jgi:RNA polymerase sigma-70 factor (ECF subfamily)
MLSMAEPIAAAIPEGITISAAAGRFTMTETRVSLLERVRDLHDGRSWGEFHDIYRPLILGYLRGVGVREDEALDVTQVVFCNLMARMPSFQLDRRKGKFRSYLWRLTHNTLVDRARRRKVRIHAEEEWVRRFREDDGADSLILEQEFLKLHRERIIQVALPRVRAEVSREAWACFEGRLIHRRPAADLANELGLTVNLVYVHASRVLQKVRRHCAAIEGELGDDDHVVLP